MIDDGISFLLLLFNLGCLDYMLSLDMKSFAFAKVALRYQPLLGHLVSLFLRQLC